MLMETQSSVQSYVLKENLLLSETSLELLNSILL